jgi:hypothetical protein
MKHLSEPQFECLDAISANGALCPAPETPGRYIAIGSPRVGVGHSGWEAAIVNALYFMGLIKKSESGEYPITPRGAKACEEYRVAMTYEAMSRAAQDTPGKIVMLKDYRK